MHLFAAIFASVPHIFITFETILKSAGTISIFLADLRLLQTQSHAIYNSGISLALASTDWHEICVSPPQSLVPFIDRTEEGPWTRATRND